MCNALTHRGPDDEGFFYSNNINLAMRRLSIIDLATGKQPIHNEDASVWTVFNGEIYNFRELREELEKAGHRFYTDHSDTEVIVHLYEEYGSDFPLKINGMFAIALWDARKQQLFLYRDRMGVKPLFYSIANGQLVFGSEIKAILSHDDCAKEINHAGIYHYVTFKNVPSPLTAFKDIYSLRPGEMLVWNAVACRHSLHKWWKLCFAENNTISAKDAADTILALLESATRLRMQSDVPFGAYLSGGVDSSSVVALMTRFADYPVKTFSLGYADELKNKEADLFYARKVSRHYGTEHYEYIMSSGELLEDIDDVITSFDQPFSGTISTFFLSKLIKKHVKVALSGDGADELFGSYLSHRVAQPMAYYRYLIEEGRLNALSSDDLEKLKPCDISFLADLYERSCGGDEVLWRYALYPTRDEEKKSLFTQDFLKQSGSVDSLSFLRKEYSILTAKDPLNRVLEMEIHTQFPDQVLAFVDFLSMAHSIEVRSPFLDYRLVEFAATIPGHLKINNGNVKDILKKAVKPLLPDGISQRPKEGFVLPIFDWMIDNFKDYSQSVLTPKRLSSLGILNPDSVNAIVMEYYSGNRSHASKIWNLMMLQLWGEKYFA
jgi:asparagine synthase (glutamine-hydrolysing)